MHTKLSTQTREAVSGGALNCNTGDFYYQMGGGDVLNTKTGDFFWDIGGGLFFEFKGWKDDFKNWLTEDW